jgi:hypothetical protein
MQIQRTQMTPQAAPQMFGGKNNVLSVQFKDAVNAAVTHLTSNKADTDTLEGIGKAITLAKLKAANEIFAGFVTHAEVVRQQNSFHTFINHLKKSAQKIIKQNPKAKIDITI